MGRRGIAQCILTDRSSTLAHLGSALPVAICLLLISVFSTLSLSDVIIANIHARLSVFVPKLFLVLLLSFAIFFALVFFLCPASVVARVEQDRPSTVESRGQSLVTLVRHNVVIIGILLFYVISNVPDLLKVINESMCWNAWSQWTGRHGAATLHHVLLFYYIERVILTSLMTLLCWSFRRVVLRHNLLVTFGLATLASTMSCMWIDMWFIETMENLQHGSKHKEPHNLSTVVYVTADTDDVDVYNRTKACLSRNTSIDYLLAKYERFFYPCTFELALLVIHCLVVWYKRSESSSSTCSHESEKTALLSFTDRSIVRSGNDVVVTSHASSDDGSRLKTVPQCSMLLLIITTLVHVVYCLLAFLAVYAHVHYLNNVFYLVRIWYGTFYQALMTVVIVCGMFVAGSVRNCRASTTLRCHSHVGVEYLVLFTIWAPLVKSLLTIIAYSSGSPEWMTVSVRTFNILGQTMNILHVTLQTVFVFYAKRLRCTEPSCSHVTTSTGSYSTVPVPSYSRSRRAMFRLVLLILALSNLSFWMKNSFVDVNFAHGYSYHCRFYHHWIPVVSFILPVVIFYYFNCAILCIDIFLNC